MALTERAIRDAKPGDRQRILWDEKVKGLGLRITPAGAMAFILNYRVDGRERRATIGRPPAMSLKEARERAGNELTAIRDGIDPLERAQERKEAPTVAEGVDRFFTEYVPRRKEDGRLTERTERNYRKQWERTNAAWEDFGKKKITDVTRQDIERAIKPRGRVERNRTLAFLSRLFNLFEAWELRPQHSNPCRHIEKAKEQPRDRVFAPSELAALADALSRIDSPVPVACIRFLLMTGWRVGEPLALRWEHINFETCEITLPATKTGRQVRTVAAMALQLLNELPRVNGNDFVFAGERSAAITPKTLRECFKKVCELAGISDCRLQDIRRTVATTAAASGLNVILLRDLLNHSTLAMANRYARRANTALQEAHDASAARMAAMMEGDSGKVVPLRRSS